MIQIKQTAYIVIACALFMHGAPFEIHAAEISFVVAPNANESDTVTIIEAYVDPEGESLNAIEGIIGLHDSGVSDVSLVVVETGGSIFSLWPVTPVYSEEEKVIRFTGGSTENIVEKGLLFRMRIFSEKSGDVSLSWLGGSAYRSDGEGTKEGISSRSLTISLSQSEPNQISASSPDSKPPVFDTLEVSQDPDTYDGKYFLSFHATDDISGVSKYEVVEDQITTEVSNGIYVLRDQERNTKVVVIAYDQAGNSTSIKVPTKHEGLVRVVVVVAILLLVLIVIFRRKIRLK